MLYDLRKEKTKGKYPIAYLFLYETRQDAELSWMDLGNLAVGCAENDPNGRVEEVIEQLQKQLALRRIFQNNIGNLSQAAAVQKLDKLKKPIKIHAVPMQTFLLLKKARKSTKVRQNLIPDFTPIRASYWKILSNEKVGWLIKPSWLKLGKVNPKGFKNP